MMGKNNHCHFIYNKINFRLSILFHYIQLQKGFKYILAMENSESDPRYLLKIVFRVINS